MSGGANRGLRSTCGHPWYDDYPMTQPADLKLATELAGMHAPSGQLTRRVGATLWPRPARVWIDGDRLCSDPGPGGVVTVDDTDRLLERFLRLADSDEQEIVTFAAQLGVLGICAHGLPSTHAALAVTFPDREGCNPIGWPSPYEPVLYWRSLARQAKAILRWAGLLHRGLPVDDEIRLTAARLVNETIPDFGGQILIRMEDADLLVVHLEDAEPTSEQDRVQLGWLVDQWLRIGDVRLAFSFAGSKGTLRFEPGGLFGSVATHVALAVARSAGIAFCASCTQAFPPRRSTQKYCSRCGDRARMRDAQRARRARRRSG